MWESKNYNNDNIFAQEETLYSFLRYYKHETLSLPVGHLTTIREVRLRHTIPKGKEKGKSERKTRDGGN